MTPSATASQATPQTHPANPLGNCLPSPLRNALSSLNVQLDHELARYRYAKRGEAQPAATAQLRPRRRSLTLIDPPAPTTASPAAAQVVTPPPPPPNSRLQRAEPAPAATTIPSMGTSPASIPADMPAPTSEVAALRSALVHRPSPNQEDYLASSEALLESLQGEYPGPTPETWVQTPETHWGERLATPLGLGALLLLLVTSAGFGFVMVSPVAVQHLVDRTPLARFWSDTAEETADEPADATVGLEGQDELTARTAGRLSPLSPNLSQQEFTNLDLSTLSTLPSGSIRTDLTPVNPANQAEQTTEPTDAAAASDAEARDSAATPKPSAAAPAVPTTTVMPRPAPPLPPRETPATSVSPATPRSAPAAPTSSAPPAAESAPSPVPANPYYVVTDYTGDPSLTEARQVVEDAYVRNFETGARIQLGVFSNEASAAARVAELQSQGIEAQVYVP